MHLTYRDVSFSFSEGIGSIYGNFETHSGWNCLPMSHWPFSLFHEWALSLSKEKSSTFKPPISDENAFVSP